ncbi:C6 transcription factor [Pseudohyphozyma bogoriensis]|nr:C6 transcription factor [Pseudohyphozyma bogoriensis]
MSESDLAAGKEPSSGKAKPGRTRAACSACRCVLYGLECELDAETQANRASANGGTPRAPVKRAAAPPPAESVAVSEALKVITRKLERIEAFMEDSEARSRRSASANVSQAFNFDGIMPSTDPSPANAASPSDPIVAGIDVGPQANPMALLQASVEQAELYEKESTGVPFQTQSASPSSSTGLESVLGGMISRRDCEAAFQFFKAKIEPWIPLFPVDHTQDNSAFGVHARSPFLFHVVLLVTAYFNDSSTPRAAQIYRALNDTVTTLIGQLVLAPSPDLLNADLVRAIGLLLLYKPVQETVYVSRGVTDLLRIEQASKTNPVASAMLQALLVQTARTSGLVDAPKRFLVSITNGTTPAADDLTLFYRLILGDIHTSLNSGRPMSYDPTEALQTTRTLIALKRHPYDVRMAALLELYSAIRPRNASASRNSPIHDLLDLNRALDLWEREWTPILAEAQLGGDPLAYTALQSHRQFCTAVISSSVFHKWSAERQKSLAEGGNGRPTLSDDEWMALQKCVDACEKAVFVLSTESKEGGAPLRSYRWPENYNGFREALHLDPVAVDAYKTAFDSQICLMMSYPLILLCRIGSAGLMSCELLCRRLDYEAGCDLNVPQALTTGRKLPRLLELASAFLASVAPRPSHPATALSRLLSLILKTGLGERTPAASPSDSTSSKPKVPQPSVENWIWATQPPPTTQDSAGATATFPLPPIENDVSRGEAMSELLLEVDPMFFGAGADTGSVPMPMMNLAEIDWEAFQNGHG